MKISTEAKVGAFVVAVSLALAFIILTFGDIPLFRKPSRTYMAVFDNVAGLSVGAEVRVAGVKAGKVREIKVKDGKVEVFFEVLKDIPIYKDASVEIGTLGLMGDKYLSVIPGSPQAGELQEGGKVDKVHGYADTDLLIKEMTNASEALRITVENLQMIMTENRESIRLAIQNIALLSENLNLMVVENRENLRASIKNLNLLLTSLNRTLPQTIASIEKLTKDLDSIAVENKEDVRVIVTNLKQISSDLKTTLPELTYNLNEMSKNLNTILVENREGVKEATSNLSQALASLKESSEKLNLILGRIEKGEGTLGKLVKDEELYQNISKLTKTLSKTGDVAERTNLYVGFRGEVYKEGDSKGILTLRLQPDNEKYYLLEVVGDSRGRFTREEYNATVVIKKEFKPELTLQYARIFPVFGDKQLVIRGGLKESTGGIGVDLVYNDRLTFTSDLWDFGRRDYKNIHKDLKANLQVSAEYKVKGPLYIRAGGDDLLNSKLRGPFIGIGLLFTDNDLKYLLGGIRAPLP